MGDVRLPEAEGHSSGARPRDLQANATTTGGGEGTTEGPGRQRNPKRTIEQVIGVESSGTASVHNESEETHVISHGRVPAALGVRYPELHRIGPVIASLTKGMRWYVRTLRFDPMGVSMDFICRGVGPNVYGANKLYISGKPVTRRLKYEPQKHVYNVQCLLDNSEDPGSNRVHGFSYSKDLRQDLINLDKLARPSKKAGAKSRASSLQTALGVLRARDRIVLPFVHKSHMHVLYGVPNGVDLYSETEYNASLALELVEVTHALTTNVLETLLYYVTDPEKHFMGVSMPETAVPGNDKSGPEYDRHWKWVIKQLLTMMPAEEMAEYSQDDKVSAIVDDLTHRNYQKKRLRDCVTDPTMFDFDGAGFSGTPDDLPDAEPYRGQDIEDIISSKSVCRVDINEIRKYMGEEINYQFSAKHHSVNLQEDALASLDIYTMTDLNRHISQNKMCRVIARQPPNVVAAKLSAARQLSVDKGVEYHIDKYYDALVDEDPDCFENIQNIFWKLPDNLRQPMAAVAFMLTNFPIAHPKQRAVWLYGQSDAGKSFFFNQGLQWLQPMLNNVVMNGDFAFGEMQNPAFFVVLDDAQLTFVGDADVNRIKNVFAAASFSVNQKYRLNAPTYPMPCIMLSNTSAITMLHCTDRSAHVQAVENRCYYKGQLQPVHNKPDLNTVQQIYIWLCKCAMEYPYDKTLPGSQMIPKFCHFLLQESSSCEFVRRRVLDPVT